LQEKIPLRVNDRFLSSDGPQPARALTLF